MTAPSSAAHGLACGKWQDRGTATTSRAGAARGRAWAAALAGACACVALVGASARSARAGTSGASVLRVLVDVGRALPSERTLSYPLEQVFPTTVRYLRVDRGFSITERDADAGFILFSFKTDSGAAVNGSIELVRTTDPGGRQAVKAHVKTTGGPAHLPHAILDGLATKLRAELGLPVTPPPPPPAEKPDPKPPEDPDGPTVLPPAGPP